MIPQLPIIAEKHRKRLKKLKINHIDITHTFGVLELINGNVYIETMVIDIEDIELRELLFSRDGKIFTILQRQRTGKSHNEMRSYSRDSILPVGTKVKLCQVM